MANFMQQGIVKVQYLIAERFKRLLFIRLDEVETFLPAPQWTQTSHTPTSLTFTSAVTLESR